MFVSELLNGLAINVTMLVKNAINSLPIALTQLYIVLAQIGVLIFGIWLVPQISEHDFKDGMLLYFVTLSCFSMLLSDLNVHCF